MLSGDWNLAEEDDGRGLGFSGWVELLKPSMKDGLSTLLQ